MVLFKIGMEQANMEHGWEYVEPAREVDLDFSRKEDRGATQDLQEGQPSIEEASAIPQVPTSIDILALPQPSLHNTVKDEMNPPASPLLSSDSPRHRGPNPDSLEIRYLLGIAIETDLHRSFSALPQTPEADLEVAHETTSPEFLLARSATPMFEDCTMDRSALRQQSLMIHDPLPAAVIAKSRKSVDTADTPQDFPLGRGNRKLGDDRRYLKALETLIVKRMAILGSRARLREFRSDLKYRREKLVNEDADLQQRARQFSFESTRSDVERLLTLLRTSQSGREDLLELEVEYNILEDTLDREEWELKDLEARVYESLKGLNMDEFDRTMTMSHSSEAMSDDGVSLKSIRTTPDFLTILNNRYLSRKGDADILEEQLHTLRAERAHYHEEEHVLHRLGEILNDEARDFLDTFDEQHNDLQADLQRVREDIRKLREEIAAQDDTLFKNSQFDDHDPPVCEEREDSILEADVVTSNHPLFDPESCPYLERKEDWKPSFNDVNANDSISSSVINMSSFINEWLLHILRKSLVQVREFLNGLDFAKLPKSKKQLKHLILQHWNSDGTIEWSRRIDNPDYGYHSSLSQPRYTSQSIESDSVINMSDRLRSRLRLSRTRRKVAASVMMDRMIFTSRVLQKYSPRTPKSL